MRRTKGGGHRPRGKKGVSVTPKPSPLVFLLTLEKPNVIISQHRPPYEHVDSYHAHWHPLRLPQVHGDSFVSDGRVDKQSVSVGDQKMPMEIQESGES